MTAALWLAHNELQLIATARLGFQTHRHRAIDPTVRAQQFFQFRLGMVARVAGARFQVAHKTIHPLCAGGKNGVANFD